jgi:hypothetical protein
MTSTRRDFLTRVSATAAALSALPLALDSLGAMDAPRTAPTGSGDFDFTWPAKLNTSHRALFDLASIDSGRSVWRATLWENQYIEFLGAKREELSSVMVIRAEAIPLAMQQKFWDTYHMGKALNVLHPMTQQPTDRNPALLSSTRNEVPPALDSSALDQYIARGGIALACNQAFREVIAVIVKAEKVSPEEARTRAIAMLVPGVLLQPSGIFAAVRAQEAGAHYIKAS